MSPGKAVRLDHVFSQDDFDKFARLSGDDNPIHVDQQFSAQTRFGATVAHGMLLNTVFEGLMSRLVKDGRIISQDLMFHAPTYCDEPMMFEVQIVSHDDSQVQLHFKLTQAQNGTLTCSGQAVLKNS